MSSFVLIGGTQNCEKDFQNVAHEQVRRVGVLKGDVRSRVTTSTKSSQGCGAHA